MESEQRVIAERAGNTEADWSSASGSSAELPKFVEGEYERMLQLGDDPAAEADEAPAHDGKGDTHDEAELPLPQSLDAVVEGAGSAEREDALIPQLEAHMTAILAAGGRDPDPEAAAASSRSFAGRIGWRPSRRQRSN